MQDKTRLPTREQILHVRRLIASKLFGPATIVRLTGIPLRDVFRIARSMPKTTETPFPNLKKQST